MSGLWMSLALQIERHKRAVVEVMEMENISSPEVAACWPWQRC